MDETCLVELRDSCLKVIASNGAGYIKGGGVILLAETAPAAEEDYEERREDNNGENPSG